MAETTSTTTSTSTEPYKENVHKTTVKQHTFVMDARYVPIKIMGSGAYGVVVSCTDKKSQSKKHGKVAIKKVMDWSADWVDGLRILREVKLLRHFSVNTHPHVVALDNLMASPINEPFDEVYVVMEFMDTDMHKIIYSKNKLSQQHLQVWVHSTLKALMFLHSGDIIHRDLKPSNLLLNKDCTLKVCDFGLARGVGQEIDKEMTEYVVTRWYRAPELMCGCEYGHKIDVWALGCIFAELIIRKPLFPGKDYKHQFELIFDLFGTPSQEDIDAVGNSSARKYLNSMKKVQAQDLVQYNTKFGTAEKLQIDLLKRMLQFNPAKRCSVKEALDHPWVRHLGYSDSDICKESLSFDFEHKTKLPTNDKLKLKQAMWDVMREIHPELPKERTMNQKVKKK